MAAMREMMRRLRLTVNDDKTRRCRVWDESFEFLGYTIGRCYSPKKGRSYIAYLLAFMSTLLFRQIVAGLFFRGTGPIAPGTARRPCLGAGREGQDASPNPPPDPRQGDGHDQPDNTKLETHRQPRSCPT